MDAPAIGYMFALGVVLHTLFKWSRWAKPGKASIVIWFQESYPALVGSLVVNVVIVFAYLAGMLPALVSFVRQAWFPGYSDAIDLPLTTFAAVPVGWLADSFGQGVARMLDWRRAPAGGGA